MTHSASAFNARPRWQMFAVLGLALGVNFLSVAGFSHVHAVGSTGPVMTWINVDSIPVRAGWPDKSESPDAGKSMIGAGVERAHARGDAFVDLDTGVGASKPFLLTGIPLYFSDRFSGSRRLDCTNVVVNLGVNQPGGIAPVADSASVRLHLGEHGKVLDASVARSSGNAAVDQALVAGVLRCQLDPRAIDLRRTTKNLQIDYNLRDEFYIYYPPELVFP